jgi:hypothetical protein
MSDNTSAVPPAVLQAAATLVAGRISGVMATGINSNAIDTGLWLAEAITLVKSVVAEHEATERFKGAI